MCRKLTIAEINVILRRVVKRPEHHAYGPSVILMTLSLDCDSYQATGCSHEWDK